MVVICDFYTKIYLCTVMDDKKEVPTIYFGTEATAHTPRGCFWRNLQQQVEWTTGSSSMTFTRICMVS